MANFMTKRCKYMYLLKGLNALDNDKIISLLEAEYGDMISCIATDYFLTPEKYNPKYDNIGLFGTNNPSEEDVKRLHDQFISRFKKCNEICVENGFSPLFETPEDVANCLLKRREIFKWEREVDLNPLFGVQEFDDYEPPKIDKA